MIEGKGTYGIVCSSPRLPYLEIYNFDKIKILNDETIEDVENKNEVSKIFYNIENYKDERDKYIQLNLYNLPNLYFNKPIYYGEISINKISKLDYSLKKYILMNPFQITFQRGEIVSSIKNLSIEDFYIKIENLFYLIKYLNDNSFINDDLKLQNTIYINSLFKIIDYSSLINLSNISEEIFESSFLAYFSYYTYLNILNISFINIITERNEVNEHYSKKNYDKEEYEYNKEYLCNILSLIFNIFRNKSFTIILVDNLTNKNIEINLLRFLNEIKDYKYNNIKNIYYNNIFHHYLNNKYGNNKKEKLENIAKRINCYAFGILLLNSFINIDSFLDIDLSNSFQIKILKLAMYLCLNFIKHDDEIYIFEPNIEDIIEKYKTL